MLHLLAELNTTAGSTLVMVLHDLDHACRYADHLVAMHDGAIVAQGAPHDVVAEKMVRTVFGLSTMILPDPVAGTPLIVPIGARQPG